MTPHQSPSDRASSGRDARLARALVYLEAYGAERSRWPADAATLFDEFANDADFAPARDAAAALDLALAAAPAPKAGAALRQRILAAYAARPSGSGLFARLKARSRIGFGRLIPAGALAGLSALGFAAGAATAGVGASASEADPLYYAQATLVVAFNEEDALWAVE